MSTLLDWYWCKAYILHRGFTSSSWSGICLCLEVYGLPWHSGGSQGQRKVWRKKKNSEVNQMDERKTVKGLKFHPFYPDSELRKITRGCGISYTQWELWKPMIQVFNNTEVGNCWNLVEFKEQYNVVPFLFNSGTRIIVATNSSLYLLHI